MLLHQAAGEQTEFLIYHASVRVPPRHLGPLMLDYVCIGFLPPDR